MSKHGTDIMVGRLEATEATEEVTITAATLRSLLLLLSSSGGIGELEVVGTGDTTEKTLFFPLAGQ